VLLNALVLELAFIQNSSETVCHSFTLLYSHSLLSRECEGAGASSAATVFGQISQMLREGLSDASGCPLSMCYCSSASASLFSAGCRSLLESVVIRVHCVL
jgi:hypothetical protein